MGMPSRTYTYKTHLGRIYIIVCWSGYKEENGTPQAVFIAVKNANPCFKSEAEAIGRLLSLSFRLGGTFQDAQEQLKDIKCEPLWDNGILILSPADAVAKALQEAEKDGPVIYMKEVYR